MRNFLLGFIIGIGKILPGVSGSLIAIRFNLYEKIINSIINYFKDIKKNTLFLMPIFFGCILAIILFSKVILFFLDKYYIITISVFIILIITGIPDVYRKGNNLFISFIAFFISFFLFKMPIKINIGYFFMGFIESFSMIIPGISGTAIYMSLGVYEKMLLMYTNIIVSHWILFGMDFITCSLITIKIINYFFLNHKKETYSAILGFLISSIISILFCSPL